MTATLSELRAAAAVVHAQVPPTPQHAWPLLRERCGLQLWVKHENHTPAGAFKLRGGIVYFDHLLAGGATAQRRGLRHPRQPWPIDRAGRLASTAWR